MARQPRQPLTAVFALSLISLSAGLPQRPCSFVLTRAPVLGCSGRTPLQGAPGAGLHLSDHGARTKASRLKMSNTRREKLPTQPQPARSPASDHITIAGHRCAAIEQYFKRGWSISMPSIGGEWSCLGMGCVYSLTNPGAKTKGQSWHKTTNPGARTKARRLPSLYDSVRGSLLSFEWETERTRRKGTTPQSSTLNPQPSTLNPQPSTLNPQPLTLNPQPSTLNPQP